LTEEPRQKPAPQRCAETDKDLNEKLFDSLGKYEKKKYAKLFFTDIMTTCPWTTTGRHNHCSSLDSRPKVECFNRTA